MIKGSKHCLNTVIKISENTKAKAKKNAGSFKTGCVPWNKGKYVRLSRVTEFKKGELTMEKHLQWKGGIQHNENDCTYVNIAPYKRVRRPVLVWESFHGKIKPGLIVYHIDENKDNDNIDNLELIDRAELLRRNIAKRRK